MSPTDSTLQRQMEQSLLVPIVMLALLRARDLMYGRHTIPAVTNALAEWYQGAMDHNLWWSTADQKDALRAATRLIEQFAGPLHPVPYAMPSAQHIVHLHRLRDDNVRGFIGPSTL